MSTKKQNLYVFFEKHENPSVTNVKAGNIFLNRFCIDEETAFELSEVNHLKKWYSSPFYSSMKKAKGKNNSL